MALNDKDVEVPFTEDQLRWLSARERYLSAHGTTWSRRHMRSYTRRALAGFLILLVGIVSAFYAGDKDANSARDAIVHSGRFVSVEGCNRDYESREALRGLLLRADSVVDQQLAKGQITTDQAQVAHDFYREQLDALPSLDCRPSADAITSDPNDLPPVPAPKHAPDPMYAGPH